MTAELNLVLGLLIAAMVLYISWSHLQEHGIHDPIAFLGLTVITLTAVIVITAIPRPLGIEDTEPFRFAAAFFRSAAVALLGGYALHRWRRQEDR